MVSINTATPKTALERMWKRWTPSQKKALLESRGLSTTWAKTKTIQEMVDRGGGMVARNLLTLLKTYNQRKGSTKVIFKK